MFYEKSVLKKKKSNKLKAEQKMLICFLKIYLGYIIKLALWQRFLLAVRHLHSPKLQAYFQEEGTPCECPEKGPCWHSLLP